MGEALFSILADQARQQVDDGRKRAATSGQPNLMGSDRLALPGQSLVPRGTGQLFDQLVGPNNELTKRIQQSYDLDLQSPQGKETSNFLREQIVRLDSFAAEIARLDLTKLPSKGPAGRAVRLARAMDPNFDERLKAKDLKFKANMLNSILGQTVNAAYALQNLDPANEFAKGILGEYTDAIGNVFDNELRRRANLDFARKFLGEMESMGFELTDEQREDAMKRAAEIQYPSGRELRRQQMEEDNFLMRQAQEYGRNTPPGHKPPPEWGWDDATLAVVDAAQRQRAKELEKFPTPKSPMAFAAQIDSAWETAYEAQLANTPVIPADPETNEGGNYYYVTTRVNEGGAMMDEPRESRVLRPRPSTLQEIRLRAQQDMQRQLSLYTPEQRRIAATKSNYYPADTFTTEELAADVVIDPEDMTRIAEEEARRAAGTQASGQAE